MMSSNCDVFALCGLRRDAVAEAVVARIDETVKEYGRQFDTLMGMLKEQVMPVLSRCVQCYPVDCVEGGLLSNCSASIVCLGKWSNRYYLLLIPLFVAVCGVSQGEQAGEILRFLTFRLDFNDFHQQQRAFGGSVGLTATPPAHLKAGASRAGFFTEPQFGGDGSDRLAVGGTANSPQRSDSPIFGFNGPEAWTVSDGADGSGGGARAPPAGLAAKAAVKPRTSVGGSSKYMR